MSETRLCENCPYRCFSSADVGAVREPPLRLLIEEGGGSKSRPLLLF